MTSRLWRKPTQLERGADAPQKEELGLRVVIAQVAGPSGGHRQLDRRGRRRRVGGTSRTARWLVTPCEAGGETTRNEAAGSPGNSRSRTCIGGLIVSGAKSRHPLGAAIQPSGMH